MVCDAISFKGTITMKGTDGNMDAKYYCTVLEEGLLLDANKKLGEYWTLMLDGGPSLSELKSSSM